MGYNGGTRFLGKAGRADSLAGDFLSTNMPKAWISNVLAGGADGFLLPG